MGRHLFDSSQLSFFIKLKILLTKSLQKWRVPVGLGLSTSANDQHSDVDNWTSDHKEGQKRPGLSGAV